MNHQHIKTGVAVLFGLAFSVGALAGEARFSKDAIQVVPSKDIKNSLLMVSGPNGYYTEMYSERGMPEVNLKQFGKLEDGMYRWHLTGATNKKIEMHKSELYSGRDEKAGRMRNVAYSENGIFWVKSGRVLKIDTDKKEPEPVRKEKKWEQTDD